MKEIEALSRVCRGGKRGKEYSTVGNLFSFSVLCTEYSCLFSVCTVRSVFFGSEGWGSIKPRDCARSWGLRGKECVPLGVRPAPDVKRGNKLSSQLTSYRERWRSLCPPCVGVVLCVGLVYRLFSSLGERGAELRRAGVSCSVTC